jgi:hypothetical protein
LLGFNYENLNNKPLDKPSDIIEQNVSNSILNHNGLQTVVTHEHIISNELIKLGQTFISFGEFLNNFKKYCLQTSQLFVIAKAYLLKEDDDSEDENENDNKDDFDDENGEDNKENEEEEEEEGDEEKDEEVEEGKSYKTVTYHCIRHTYKNNKKESSRKGIRKNQQHNGCNCKTYIRINFQKCGPNRGLYKISRTK